MNPACDVHELVRRFNEDEAVWSHFVERRALRRMLGSRQGPAEQILDRLDWIAAERECREVRVVGSDAR